MLVLGHGAMASAAPANDDFANAQALSGSAVATSDDTTDATDEIGEPDHDGAGGEGSVWFKWTAPSNGQVSVDICDQSFGPALAVYTGPTVLLLTEVSSSYCAVRFAASEGTTYMIAVDGGSPGASGWFGLRLDLNPPPANDDFAAAEVLGGTMPTAAGDTRGATREAGEPDHGGAGGDASVWFEWTVPVTGKAEVDVCGSGFDSILAVYTGSAVDALSGIASDECRVTFPATAGTTYMIAVDGEGGSSDRGAFSLSAGVFEPPENDDFADARALEGFSPSAFGSTRGATREAGEPDHAGEGGDASVWYRWTARQTGVARVDICDSSFDSVLAVYTGTVLSGLNEVESGYRCRMVFQATSGTSYEIAVDGEGPNSVGTFALGIDVLQPPDNDDFANAQVLSGTTFSVPGDTGGATHEAGEPSPPGDHGPGSVWFAWTAPASGAAVINMCESDLFPAVGVYTGSAVGSLTLVKAGDCYLAFDAVASTTYMIAVDGVDPGDFGTFTLDGGVFQPPANDDFEDAQDLSGAVDSVEGDNRGATEEAGEPDHTGFGFFEPGPSVWYSWTAQQTGTAVVDVCEREAATILAIYTGTAVDSLTTVSTGNCQQTFQAIGGTNYKIAVSAYAMGAFTLNVGIFQPPANDDFADAQVLSGAVNSVDGDNHGATAEAGEPDHGGGRGFASVWYRWAAPASGTAIVDICGGGFRSIGVYTGSAVDALEAVGETDDDCAVRFQATQGTTYDIAVDGDFERPMGAFALHLGVFQPPANDDFADAQMLDGSSLSVVADNRGASHEAGEPDHDFQHTSASVWYRWTAPASGTATIDTCGVGEGDGAFDTVLAVYAGSSLSGLSELGSSDDGCGPDSGGSSVELAVSAGTTYRIALDGDRGDQGQATLRLDGPAAAPTTGEPSTPAPPAPPGDSSTPPPAAGVPGTSLRRHPRRTLRTSKRRVRVVFRFSSNVAGAAFRCKLDRRRFAPCRSPKRYSVKHGRHRFLVQAVDGAGADPTPARFTFKVRWPRREPARRHHRHTA
jgi:hypothetical protein